MSDYNLKKGEDLFFKEIQNLCLNNVEYSQKMNYLASMFSGKVGVMQEGNPTNIIFKDKDNFIFEINAIPAYKKLSNCILHTVINCDSQDDLDLVNFVIKSYNNADYKNYMKQEVKNDNSNNILNNSINEEIEKNSLLSKNLIIHNILDIDDNGNSFSRELEMDNIDLIDDFDNEDLTLEGMRTVGLINFDHDSLTNDNYELKNNRNVITLGKVDFDVDGTPIITCPYTGSKNVYQIDSSTYASFDTDQPFRVIFNLADVKPN